MPTFSYTSGNPSNLIAGGNASMSDVQGPFTDLRTFINGGLGTSNLTATAGILESQLASAGNGLAKGAFSAHRNAAQNVGGGSTTIVYDTEAFDLSGWFNTANGRYTPQVAGYYRLSWGVGFAGVPAADAYINTHLQMNGVSIRAGSIAFQRGVNAAARSVGTAIVSANGSTDFFSILAASDASPATVAGSIVTYFEGEMIGRA